ncbi:MAG TPA: tetratricopeptide repeat protein [Acidobacteriaceae bacterium]|nr:tetratricopeptide repeat protein [Acidobacteriaceae bacterium]
MSLTRSYCLSVVGLLACLAAPSAQAGDIHIRIPRRSELTPVQKLNRSGVDAVVHHQYDKAEALFYKAYLYDPGDPFTLNNLGYVSELKGQIERAQTFYKLAAEQGCGAVIARSDNKALQGKPMTAAIDARMNGPMRINRLNLEGLELISQGQGFEAQQVLQQALQADPQNAFTLNNLGVASESVGDYDSALKYYDQAAAMDSKQAAVITLKKGTRGAGVSKLAAQSAENLRRRMRRSDMTQERATMLEMRGVYELNSNEVAAAKQDFLDAYRLNPNSAFTLNNLGYVSELDGDLETAQFFYARARQAGDANSKVGMASEASAQGLRLISVANDSNQKVDGRLETYSQERHEEQGPVELTPRYGSLEPDKSAARPQGSPSQPQQQ